MAQDLHTIGLGLAQYDCSAAAVPLEYRFSPSPVCSTRGVPLRFQYQAHAWSPCGKRGFMSPRLTRTHGDSTIVVLLALEELAVNIGQRIDTLNYGFAPLRTQLSRPPKGREALGVHLYRLRHRRVARRLDGGACECSGTNAGRNHSFQTRWPPVRMNQRMCSSLISRLPCLTSSSVLTLSFHLGCTTTSSELVDAEVQAWSSSLPAAFHAARMAKAPSRADASAMARHWVAAPEA